MHELVISNKSMINSSQVCIGSELKAIQPFFSFRLDILVQVVACVVCGLKCGSLKSKPAWEDIWNESEVVEHINWKNVHPLISCSWLFTHDPHGSSD